MMHFDKSIEIVDSIKIGSHRTKRLSIMEAQGFVLAEDIIADHNSPELPTSAMDGYALRHEDMLSGRLRIASINPAGSDNKEIVHVGECIKTFTGSLMPEGSDTLIPIEMVKVVDGHIIIQEQVPFGFSVRNIGENYNKGQKLIPSGELIDFPQIGVLASLNIASVLVYEKPIVAIISTGSELLDIGQEQTKASQIRSSNNYTIEGIVCKYGGTPLQLGCIKDDKESITATISDAIERSDIVVTTGGVSVGDFDFVKDVIYELDCQVLFKGVRVKPGQHIMIARRGDKFIIGLPGFAYSSTVMALVYLIPLIQKLQCGSMKLPHVKAILKSDFVKKAKKAEFTACNISLEDGKFFVDFDSKRAGSSAILTNTLGSLALLYTTEDESGKSIGDEVTVVLL